ncbi:MAG: P-type DNA transfer ATPase VirB11 [Alphaproteobacteria bacterium]|nr:P-type DNA transfer ATPase VirB11 [Alphaproteobacteria bacterium]
MKAANISEKSDTIISLPASGYLQEYLAIFSEYLKADNISEICVNRPGELWIETMGQPVMECIKDPKITNALLERLGRLIASTSLQSVSAQKPLLSAVLPTGERIQMALPPIARHGVAFSIRKQVVQNMNLDDYAKAGAFDQVDVIQDIMENDKTCELRTLVEKKQFQDFLSKATKAKKNIIVSGGTSSGKTTFLNAMLKEIDPSERLVTIEDTPEVVPIQQNHLSLVASKGDQSIAKITIQDLLEASLRFRPDRILLGELRGKEAYSFLRAVNTGHPGSITTVHADTPRGALEQITLMVMQGENSLNRSEIMAYISRIIDVVVQLKREGGKRFISEIWYP